VQIVSVLNYFELVIILEIIIFCLISFIDIWI